MAEQTVTPVKNTEEKRPSKAPDVRVGNIVIYKTLCLYVCFGVLGLASPLLGTTVVHLECLFDTNTATMSFTFMVHSIGYLCGSVLCGLIYDTLNHELSFAVATLVEGSATIVAPFLGIAGGLPVFIGTMCVQAMSQGFIDAAGQSYTVGLWSRHRFREPVLQAAHAAWSLGGTVSPFIIARFLVELSQKQTTEASISAVDNSSSLLDGNGSLVNKTGEASSQCRVSAQNASFSSGTMEDTIPLDVSGVCYAYVVIGSLIMVASIMFIVAFFWDRSNGKKGKQQNEINGDDRVNVELLREPASHAASDSKDVASCKCLPVNSKYVIFVFLLFLFYHFYLYVEAIPIAYLTTFSIKYLQFSVKEASLLMSVFYGFHFGGRVAGIPVSGFLRPRTMVLIDLTLTAAAYMLLLMVVNVWPEVVWPSAALAGFGMATTFATAVLWIADIIPMTGRIASVLLCGSSLGGVIGPFFVGTMFNNVSPMWFVYVLVVFSVGHIALFVFMLTYVRKCGSHLRDENSQNGECIAVSPTKDDVNATSTAAAVDDKL